MTSVRILKQEHGNEGKLPIMAVKCQFTRQSVRLRTPSPASGGGLGWGDYQSA